MHSFVHSSIHPSSQPASQPASHPFIHSLIHSPTHPPTHPPHRYKHLIGKEVVVPCSGGRRIPVIADTYVDREFGTGALKITPGHDPNDYELGKKYNLPLINIMNRDASINGNGGVYEVCLHPPTHPPTHPRTPSSFSIHPPTRPTPNRAWTVSCAGRSCGRTWRRKASSSR